MKRKTKVKKVPPTKGQWKAYWQTNKAGEADCGVFSEPHPGMAYAVCRAPRFQTREQWETDAALMSAAPDLLAALKRWSFGECLVFTENSNPTCECNGCITRRALAKAECHES